MAQTLTIRLDDFERNVLQEEARRHGIGLSAFIRSLAEIEARRLYRESIKSQGQIVVSYLRSNPRAADELADYGTPVDGLP